MDGAARVTFASATGVRENRFSFPTLGYVLGEFMQFDTKIAVVIRNDLEAWQKLNVASFLTSGVAAASGVHRRRL